MSHFKKGSMLGKKSSGKIAPCQWVTNPCHSSNDYPRLQTQLLTDNSYSTAQFSLIFLLVILSKFLSGAVTKFSPNFYNFTYNNVLSGKDKNDHIQKQEKIFASEQSLYFCTDFPHKTEANIEILIKDWVLTMANSIEINVFHLDDCKRQLLRLWCFLWCL